MILGDKNIRSTTTPDSEVLRAARAIDTGNAGGDHSIAALASSVGNIVRDYPGPALLMGAGLAWMLVSREQKKSQPLPLRMRARAIHGSEQIRDAALGAKDSLLDTAGDARERLSEAASGAKEQAVERMHDARIQAGDRIESAKASVYETAGTAKDAYQGLLEESPLVVGAIAMVAGVALGLLLPATHQEDELMGPTRDSLLDQAKTIVDDARRAAVDTIRSGSGNVKAHLEEAAGEAKATLKESIGNAKSAVKDDLASAKDGLTSELPASIKSPSSVQSSMPKGNKGNTTMDRSFEV